MNEQQSFTDSESGQAVNTALDDVDRALSRLNKILERQTSAMIKSVGAAPRRKGKNSLLRSGLNGFARSFASSLFSDAGHGSDNNRFPASNNQWLTDLASMLQRMNGRNL